MASSTPQISPCETQNSFTNAAKSFNFEEKYANRGLSVYSPPSGEIHVIVGPLFAGKTTTLLHRILSESITGSFQVELRKNSLQLDKTIRGLCLSGRLSEAVRLLWCTRVIMNENTYALRLQECIFRKEYRKGRRIHAQMIVVGYVSNEYLKIKLLILYAKSGNLRTASILFDKLFKKNLISWNAMISGFVQKGCVTENVVVNSALMDMYFKCCGLDDGRKVFDKSLDRNVVTWTALISGYGQHGRVNEVLESFERMKYEGFRPNYVTFLAVVSACSHGGLVDEGFMEIWKFAANKYFELDPEDAGKYVVLSNAYATFGYWDNVVEVREMMKSSGIIKEPGYSRIEVQGEVQFFLRDDRSHKLSTQICKLIKVMTSCLKDTGYVPDLSSA
ncbi:hypothetical protein SLE2022_367780 [Rubroshorea leprosula]